MLPRFHTAHGWPLPLITAIALSLSGCGGAPDNVTEVHGTVTLDGSPLPNAAIEFQPEKGRPSFGSTAPDGQYTLQYTPQHQGAEVGKHTVRITTRAEFSDPTTGKTVLQPEKLPPKYHRNSELTREVQPGSNEINFELTGK